MNILQIGENQNSPFSLGDIYGIKITFPKSYHFLWLETKKKLNSGNTSFVGERLVSLEISSHIISVILRTCCLQITLSWGWWHDCSWEVSTSQEMITEILLRQILPKWIIIYNLILKFRHWCSPDIEEALLAHRNKSEVLWDSTNCLLSTLFSYENFICIFSRKFRLRRMWLL